MEVQWSPRGQTGSTELKQKKEKEYREKVEILIHLH